MSWIKVCEKDTVPRLGSRIVKSGDIEIGIFRTSEDKFYALNNMCPHEKGPLSQGIVFGDKVACPLHNWKIDLKTGKVDEPDEGSTRCFKVKIEGNYVFLEIG
jgi:nitrite reductase (NADH) small subunit